MTWLLRRRLFWPCIAVAWAFIGGSLWWMYRIAPESECYQGMTLMPGQSCRVTIHIPLELMPGPRREASY